MILRVPSPEGPPADRAEGRLKREKARETNPAKRRSCLIRSPLIAEKGPTNRASRRVDQIEKITKNLHPPDCLTNSSKEQFGLIPGHAPFAISQVCLSLRSAG
jgi:hypothetical protein